MCVEVSSISTSLRLEIQKACTQQVYKNVKAATTVGPLITSHYIWFPVLCFQWSSSSFSSARQLLFAPQYDAALRHYQQFHSHLQFFNPLNAELNPTCYLLALLRAHHILHFSRIRVKQRCINCCKISY